MLRKGSPRSGAPPLKAGTVAFLSALVLLFAIPASALSPPAGIGWDNTISARKGKAKTVAELSDMYDSRHCMECHSKAGEEWELSAHSEPILGKRRPGRKALAILTIFDVARDEWPFAHLDNVSEVKVEHLMGCARCHLAQLADAEDSVARELVGDFVRWRDANNSGNVEAARAVEEKLSELSINCLICHNRNANTHKWSDGYPQYRTVYGSNDAAHPCGEYPSVRESAIIGESILCGQCHGLGPLFDRDNPTQCPTAYGFYLYDYKPRGGDESCQDCHMRRTGLGHNIASYRNRAMIEAALDFDVDVAPVVDSSPKFLLKVELTNKAGHPIPDGCPTVTRLVLEVVARGPDGSEIFFQEKTYMPISQDYARGDKMARGPFEKAGLIIDTSLPTLRKVTERYEIPVPQEALALGGEGEREFAIDVKLLYLPYGSTKAADDPIVWREVVRKLKL